ncbi:BREX-1 system adenine-specific DNA-methyltransferase PglX [Paenibacillus sp. SC116]|uniref:BREX-1 system adenine-specific DNA-methyltransferase PglX n=1 Tax=Paenibacillus sp. SC116 TaxID=2968986 RepID=UPI00215A1266|nr:BREX-1 system adenine-specific DNA-methyltransferase PglX [Paenibacillus sp. SC116]MCR8844362.1 BREX-1 system adenine-specific DNA-methyltransferase PglX [Paenibacillus sp. SC116]
MNKTALKNLATNARKELIEKVKARAFKIGITEENIKKAHIESSGAIYIDGKPLSSIEKEQRDKLISRINEIGFKQVVEEVAYTWFNRFTALRFMEVNNYLPTKVRVLSSSNSDSSEPDIIKEALTVDLEIDKELVYEWKINNKTEELYKYLIIEQCNALNKVLPFMFETIDDYKAILFPEGLLAKNSFLREMTDVTAILEQDWEDVEIIGWMYQFYISEKKDQVFADLKMNIKISKDNIPAATQLFTPNWLVKYMVENSLGRIWLESYPETSLKSCYKYYLDESQQEEPVITNLEKIQYNIINPEEITFFDPSCGSGHILVYAFDVLYDIYLEKGYIDREIPKLILEKNLFGLDIDERAVQLASFSLMMKARGKSRRVFEQGIKLNISAIQETNWITNDIINVLVDENSTIHKQDNQRGILEYLRDVFRDSKEYGSILNVKPLDLDFLEKQLIEFANDSVDQGDITQLIAKIEILEKLPNILLQAKVMGFKYDVVCTNPPYMGSGGMNDKVSKYVKKHHSNSKSDMFAVFIEKCLEYTKENGYNAMLTMHSWMFLSSFKELRKNILSKNIINLIHIGYNSFPELNSKVAQAVSFVIKNNNIESYTSKYLDLTNKYPQSFDKENAFDIEKNNGYFLRKVKDFIMLPESPIAYWMGAGLRNAFIKGNALSEIGTTRLGMTTGDNNKFTRFWHEVDQNKLCLSAQNSEQFLSTGAKWVPYNKGGKYRKWYGNNDVVLNWEQNGFEIKNFKDDNGRIRSTVPNTEYYFQECLSWSKVTSGDIAFRYKENGFIFDVAGACLFVDDQELHYILGFVNSKIASTILSILSPTLNYEGSHVSSLPIMLSEEYKDRIEELVRQNISISKSDWDRFESSWNFKINSLIKHKSNTIMHSFKNLQEYSEKQFTQLKTNEEELNRIFIEIYGLEDEVSPEVDEGNVSLRKTDLKLEVKSFLSYAVGCMFGRYSLDSEGLVFAGGNYNLEKYRLFSADKDNILPIVSGGYFEDDIVSKFLEIVKVVFGEEILAENLEYLAETLGKKDGESVKETLKRYYLNDFYKDHLQTYKKRPIYWLFTSGKQKAFNCLIYMHRYDKSTLSRIRTDYLHELQIRMDVEKKTLLDVINGDGTTKEIANAKKELKSLDLKIEELRAYDEKLRHMADMQIEIDLDDGVAVNYAKFEGLLAPIK